MLNVLLESKAVRTKRMGGTLMSVLVHGGIIAAIVTLGVRPTSVDARTPDFPKEPSIYRIPVRPNTERPRGDPRPSHLDQPIAPTHTWTLPRVDDVPAGIPPVDLTATPITDATEFTRGVSSGTGGADSRGPSSPAEGVLEERYVDRPPHVIGTPVQPVFPMSLRERGLGGRVSVQFVVDTLGRAEMTGLRVVEATDPLFAQSVRAVLPRYRFSPGEVGGQKVRTLVQLPFEFSLVR